MFGDSVITTLSVPNDQKALITNGIRCLGRDARTGVLDDSRLPGTSAKMAQEEWCGLWRTLNATRP